MDEWNDGWIPDFLIDFGRSCPSTIGDRIAVPEIVQRMENG
jgi:hypothetical protein